MKRRDLNDKLAQADVAGVWAFTLPSFSTLMGGVDQAYLKLMMKRLADQGVSGPRSAGHLRQSMPDRVRQISGAASCDSFGPVSLTT